MSAGERGYSRLRSIVDLCGAIAMTGAAVFLVWVNWPSPPVVPIPKEPISLVGAHLRGSESAKVAILEYSDFECPFCSRFAHEILPGIDQTYVVPGRVLFAFKHLPLEAVHSNALSAAQASQCAAAEGKFWPMHDELFVNPKELSDVHIRAKAKAAGLDLERFQECLSSAKSTEPIRAEVRQAASYGITGTPAFLIGRLQSNRTMIVARVLKGALPLSEFKKILETLLTSVP